MKFELQLKALLSILALSLSETHNVFYGYSRQPIKVSQRHQQPATEHHHRKSKTTTEQECSRAAATNNMRMIPPRWTPNNTSAAPLDTANNQCLPARHCKLCLPAGHCKVTELDNVGTSRNCPPHPIHNLIFKSFDKTVSNLRTHTCGVGFCNLSQQMSIQSTLDNAMGFPSKITNATLA